MKRAVKKITNSLVSIALIICLCMSVGIRTQAEEQTLSDRLGITDTEFQSATQELPYYSREKEKLSVFPQDACYSVSGEDYTSYKGEKPDFYDDGGVLTEEKTNEITWEINVETAGAYALEVVYLAPSSAAVAPQRELFINGHQSYYEQEILQFERRWNDAAKPARNSLGDEVRPEQLEMVEFVTKKLTDQWGKTTEPLLFEFKEGINTITFAYINLPLVIRKISVVSAVECLPYSEVSASYKAEQSVETIVFQAEDMNFVSYRNDTSVSIVNDGDPMTRPFSATNIRYNAMGGYSFRKGGQEVCWQVDVAKAGLYKLDFRVLQNYSDGLPVYRTVKINGEVPFAELQYYELPYAKRWYNHTLSSESGEEYLFYLEEGKNTISLTATLGPVTEIVEGLLDDATELSDIIFDITMVIGQNPDINYDYRLDEEIPDLMVRFEFLRDSITESRSKLLEISEKNSAMANNLERIILEIEELIDAPDRIPLKMNDISNNLTNLSSYATSIQEIPLAIDEISLLAPEDEAEHRRSNFWQRLSVTLQNFFASFTKDYNAIATSASSDYTGEPLTLWVSRGKEWGQLLKEMIDSDFTQETGIPIKVSILPSGTVTTSINPLLLAIGAGTEPDIVMGLTYNMPVEYAIRGSLTDLSKFEDYEEIKKRFLSEMMVPYTFEGGVYALPETMSFRAMYIRTDIFSSLNIGVPKTWDEVYNKLLPALSQNSMQMYIPQILDLFLYQEGGEYYTEDRLRSALDTPEAFKAFEELCKLYTDNGIPVSTDFFSRFRTGEMPIGIENHNAYLQFSYAAPEIAGKWQVYEIPGHLKADGTVDRTNSGLSIDAACILSSCSDTDAAWSFLKWWTDVETQKEYTSQVEGRLGSQARWMSSNYDAFMSLPWNVSERQAIASALSWAKETPVVRGGYYTNRHLVNAINRAVVENQAPRSSLEEAVEQINKELERKQ